MNYRLLKGRLLFAAVLIIVSTTSLSAFGFSRRDSHQSNYSVPEGIEFEDLNLTDGIYTGSADGFRPDLIVEVEVKDSKVSSITVIEHNEIGRQYYQPPIRFIPDDIVKQQQTDVDVVSGASATSYAIMSAVEDALKQASR